MSAERMALIAHPGAELFGSDRMMLESAIALKESGHRVVVALPSSGPLVDELRGAGVDVVITTLLVLRKSLLKPRNWLTLLRDTVRGLRSSIRLIRRLRPEVVYVSTITLPLWPVVARAMRAPRVVSHVHEAEGSANRLINTALYLPHLAAHRVVVNSQFSLETIRTALPALAARCTVVYNGVASPEDPTPPRTELDSPLRVLYVGRLSPRKGPDLVIEAARLLRERGVETRVSLLGSVFSGYEWFEEELRTAARDSGVEVEFLGFRPDIWPTLSENDVLVVPSRLDEPFGNTAVEGILALRPVIVSETSGLKEAAGEYDTARFFTPGDAGEIAAAIAATRDNWSQLLETTAAARSTALSRHDPRTYRITVGRACR